MRTPAPAFLRSVALLAASAIGQAAALAGVSFTVTLDKAVSAAPISGRLVVALIGPGSTLGKDAKPIDAPFDTSPQPMFGMDVKGLVPGQSVKVDDSADSFPVKLSVLPPGDYQAQAWVITNKEWTDWKRSGGNFLTPEPVKFTVAPRGDANITLTLSKVTTPLAHAPEAGVQIVEVESKLLSAFHQRPVRLRAAVCPPTAAAGVARADAPPLPAVYEITGFGGDYVEMAEHVARSRAKAKGGPAGTLAERVFWIVLDADSPNGHTLLADSSNNGPWGAAITTELIPEIERRYRLIPRPSARLLRGHSSGGWSTVWLAMTYPETFGGAWASSPDPVDFRKFQNFDLYADASAFVDKLGADRGSLRRGGKTLMTVRQETRMEQILGPNVTSGQQWASWQAVFGPRSKDNKIVPMFDPITGDLNPAVREHYRGYDISERVKSAPEKYLPAFKDRIRIICGTEDNYYLNEAVSLLRDRLNELARANEEFKNREAWTGYIKLVPGDHGTVFLTPATRAIPGEMVAELVKQGHLSAQATPEPASKNK